MLIYLIGYMGCGKTTAGKRLANQLGYKFIDLDNAIEQVEQKTISQIFESDGQNAFRLIEQRELHKTFRLTNTVVSTGGGAPCFFDNIDQMNSRGMTVYIRLTPKALVSRLTSGKNQRPLIAGKTDSELLKFIEEALGVREAFYNKALFKVNGIGLTPKRIIDALAMRE